MAIKNNSKLSYRTILLWATGAALLVFSCWLLLSLLWEEFMADGAAFHGNHYDFLAFYSAAHIALHGQIAHLFDATTLTSIQRAIVPHPVGAAGYMPFLNPPFFAVILAPLALLSITNARILLLAISFALCAWCAYKLTQQLSGWRRWLTSLLIVGSFPVYQALIEEQPSVFILAGCVAAMTLYRRGWPIIAGICLSVTAIKPQFTLLALVGLIIAKQWRVIAGMLGAIAAVAVAMLPFTGIQPYFSYITFMLKAVPDHFTVDAHPAWQGALSTSSGINGLFTGWFGQNASTAVNTATLLVSLVLLALFVLALRRIKPGFDNSRARLMFVASILLLVIDPHLYGQDLVLIFVALFALRSLSGLAPYFAIIALVDVAILDQFTPFHLFTMLAIGICAAVFATTAKMPVPAGPHPAASAE